MAAKKVKKAVAKAKPVKKVKKNTDNPRRMVLSLVVENRTAKLTDKQIGDRVGKKFPDRSINGSFIKMLRRQYNTGQEAKSWGTPKVAVPEYDTNGKALKDGAKAAKAAPKKAAAKPKKKVRKAVRVAKAAGGR